MPDVGLPTTVHGLASNGIDARLDLASLLDATFREGFGYAIGGAPWRTQALHEAGVYRKGGSMTKRTGSSPEIALARALVDALDAEADRRTDRTGDR